MGDNVTLQLVVFFVATAIAIMSCHISLIRLSASGSETAIQNRINKEKAGVLLVVEFALVILVSAPIPIATTLITPTSNPFAVAVWIVPVLMLVLAGIDLCLTKSSDRDCYYCVISIVICVLSLALLALNAAKVMPFSIRFFAALSLCLIVIVAQLLKSALRLAGILTQ